MTANDLKIAQMQTETRFDQASLGLEYRPKYVVDQDWLLEEMIHEQEDAAEADDAAEVVAEAEAVRYDGNSAKD